MPNDTNPLLDNSTTIAPTGTCGSGLLICNVSFNELANLPINHTTATPTTIQTEYASAGTDIVSPNITNAGDCGLTTQIQYTTANLPAPVASFTSDKTSGAVPLTVQFTDTSTNTPNGWAWFFGDENYTAPWTQQSANGRWGVRYGYSSVAMPDGSIVLMGGYDGSGVRNDVWRSTDNGATWSQMTGSAEWEAREHHTSVSLSDGSIVLMGGVGGGYKNDTWRSTDNGATWTLMTGRARWLARYGLTSVAMSDGSIILMGGYTGNNNLKNDVWRSTDNGATWTQVTAGAGWAPRYCHSSVAMSDGSIVLMGGISYYKIGGSTYILIKNDTWQSMNNGATWTQMTGSAGWAARYFHTSVSLPDGSIVLMGGYVSGATNDTWRSTDNGATWTQMTASAGWSARYGHSSVAMPDGSIVLMGGANSSNYYNDVWRFQPAGSSVQNPLHTYITPRIYSVALQTYNAGGYNSTRIVSYITVTAPPVANFTATPTTGYAPLTVIFSDSSTNSPTSWIWLFGDGSLVNATAQNPVHTYTDAGNYSVVLQATNAEGSNITTKTNYIMTTALPPAPVANFSATPINGTAPLTVRFTDASLNSPTAWNWNFGDGNTTNSTVQNPVHTFRSLGVYNVSLNVTNIGGSNITTRTNYITVIATEPVANFSATPTNGTVPLTVRFTDTSTNSPTAWNWSFGDGSSVNATAQNPVHTYGSAGVYTILLNATNAAGSNTITRTNYIMVTAAPVANFTATPTTGYAPLTVIFSDSSTNSPTSWIWLFGDGSFVNATAQNPVHTYTAVGNYSVALQATNAEGSNITTKTNYITVIISPAPVANFTSNVTSGLLPRTIRFTDTSTGSPTTWNWSFGDGSLAAVQNPIHTYVKAGNHTVTLTASNAGGANTTVKEKYITIYPKGDFNHNWEVDVGDVALVAYMVVNRAPAQVPDADFNANGFVDIGDAGKIAYFVVKKIPEL
ncbi:MAG: PKD domain-containing protein [Methanoregula sp.]